MAKEQRATAEDSVAIDDTYLEVVFAEVPAAMGGLFAQARTAACASDYVRALVCAPEAGSTWALAETAGHASPGRFQALLREAVWDHAAVIGQVNQMVAGDLAGDEEGVFIVDETAMIKHGSASVGVSTQHAGVTGRLENCQTIVNAVFDNGTIEAWIDFRLYLPECWSSDADRRAGDAVPEATEFATKPALAALMLTETLDRGLPVRWLAGDEVYGADPLLLSTAESRGLGYVLAVRSNHWITLESGERLTAEAALSAVADSLIWETRSCGTGSKGPRLYQWAHLGDAEGGTLLMRTRTPREGLHQVVLSGFRVK